LNKNFPLIALTILLISISPQVFAQNDLGVLVEQQNIIFEIGRHSDVHVKHIIETGAWSVDRPRIIEILPGSHSNISVADEDGDRLNFSYDGETFEESKYIILNQKLGNYDLVAEYDLKNYLELENGLWKQNIEFPFDLTLMIDEEIDMIFVNSRPIDMSDAKGINCIGCFMTLDIINNQEMISPKITINDSIDFSIDISSNQKISEFNFVGGGSNILSFDVDSDDQLLILKIPLGLLLNPFEVYFTEKNDMSLDQTDKIRKTEINQDSSHVSISFRTTGEGTVSIVGATQEEHQKGLEQIQKRNEGEIESKKIIEDKKGIPIPIPGTDAYEKLSDEKQLQKPGFSFADDLENEKVEPVENNTVIYIVLGVIIAVIIAVIIKIKKN
tara:strand:+ start:440 stop:1597 length:1158 start_codon:yes stop_codon:yes gene_type:complete